jgi:hypothetical protein
MAATAKSKTQSKSIEVTLVADRVTKGAVRFVEEKVDTFPLNIYLRKEQVSDLGIEAAEGQEIQLTIEAV